MTPGALALVAVLAVGGCALRADPRSDYRAVLDYRDTLDAYCSAGELPAADCEAHRRYLLAILRGDAQAAMGLATAAEQADAPATVRDELARLAERIRRRRR